MLLELKDKVKGFGLVQGDRPAARTVHMTGPKGAHLSDAIAALVSLGFTEDDAKPTPSLRRPPLWMTTEATSRG